MQTKKRKDTSPPLKTLIKDYPKKDEGPKESPIAKLFKTLALNP